MASLLHGWGLQLPLPPAMEPLQEDSSKEGDIARCYCASQSLHGYVATLLRPCVFFLDSPHAPSIIWSTLGLQRPKQPESHSWTDRSPDYLVLQRPQGGTKSGNCSPGSWLCGFTRWSCHRSLQQPSAPTGLLLPSALCPWQPSEPLSSAHLPVAGLHTGEATSSRLLMKVIAIPVYLS